MDVGKSELLTSKSIKAKDILLDDIDIFNTEKKATD